jgi:hypothetical protein
MGRWILLALLLTAPLSAAWNRQGHMLTGIIAYQRMPEASRRFIADRLRRHRRFDEDFRALMPASIAAGEQDLWIFAHAATWPDMVRDFGHLHDEATRDVLVAAYHRSRWHFVNLPVFLGEYEAQQLLPVPANITMAWTPGQDLADLNAIQALKRAVHMQHGGMVPEEKAVLMTWIFHLVGDIHQPLHAAALFTTGAFPTGDAGGGRLTVDGSNLHALWDDAVAAGATWYYMQQRAEELIAEYGDAGTEAATNLDFEDWLLESHELARSVAYSFQIRSTVQSFNERPRDAIPVRVGEDYIRRMREVSRRRLTEAGYRLGAWLNFFASQRD